MRIPPYAAEPASVEFHLGIFDEQIEEAGFLYEQRQAWLRSADVPWQALAPLEARIDAHIEALEIGGDLTREACHIRIIDDVGAGILFSAMSVFCRQRFSSGIAATLQEFDRGDTAKVAAITDALKFELPASWKDYCIRGLSAGDACVASILATVIGYRRIESAGILPILMKRVPQEMLPTLFWMAGRTRDKSILGGLEPYYMLEELPIRKARPKFFSV